jgi:hypothetical protein
MKVKVIQYRTLFILLLPLIFYFLPWYKSVLIAGDPSSLSTVKMGNLSGFEVFMVDRFRILIIYLCCIIIQYLAIHGKRYLVAIIGHIILIYEFTVFTTFYYPIEYSKTFFLKTFSIGYCIAITTFILCSILSILGHINYRKISLNKG